MGVYEKGRCVLGKWVMGGGGLDEYVGEQGLPWASRSMLKKITEDALTISLSSLFQDATARTVKGNWRGRVEHLCWWNL